MASPWVAFSSLARPGPIFSGFLQTNLSCARTCTCWVIPRAASDGMVAGVGEGRGALSHPGWEDAKNASSASVWEQLTTLMQSQVAAEGAPAESSRVCCCWDSLPAAAAGGFCHWQP